MVYTYTDKHGILWFLCFPTPWRVFSVYYCFFFLRVRTEPPVSHTSLLFFNIFSWPLVLPVVAFYFFACLECLSLFFLSPLARAVCSCYCRYPLLLWLLFVYISRRVCGGKKHEEGSDDRGQAGGMGGGAEKRVHSEWHGEAVFVAPLPEAVLLLSCMHHPAGEDDHA